MRVDRGFFVAAGKFARCFCFWAFERALTTSWPRAHRRAAAGQPEATLTWTVVPLPCAHGKSWLPVVASNANLNSFKLTRKTAMKPSILIAAIVACALSAPIVSAQEKSTPAKPATSMDMDKQMPQMQENMKKMQQEMAKLRATTDPKERQKLMQEHMQTMQENMQMMRGMGVPMMGMTGGKGSGTASGMMDGDPKQRQEMMEKRMDMMQMMMEQMMQHDQAIESMPAK